MMKYAFVFVLVLSPIFAQADIQVGKTPLPDWVKTLSVTGAPTKSDGEKPISVAMILDDRQVRKTDAGFEYVSRSTYRITDQSGLDIGSSISLQFDPEYETLDFNYIRVIREGETIEQLATAKIELLRQEMRLGQGIMDGHLTAAVQLTDVRVGDVIDYSYSGSVTTPLWPEEFFDVVNTGAFSPIAQLHYSVMTPTDDSLHLQKIATEVDVTVTEENGWRTHTIHLQNLEEIEIEFDVPNDWFSIGLVQFTSMSQWKDVVDWALPLFETDKALPTEFTEKLDLIAMESDDPAAQAIAVLRLVQRDIRYLSLVYGLGTHVPREPSTTIERGYGDCKDKSVLLIAALAYLGIESWPALASLYSGPATSRFLPSITAFDHVVVGIENGNETLWVDPTESYQGGSAETMTPLDLGWVLPLREGQSELQELVVPLFERPSVEVIEIINIPVDDSDPVTISSEQTFRGVLADAYRAAIAQAGEQLLADVGADFYRGVYDTIEFTQEPSIKDDQQSNTIRMTMAFDVAPEVMARRKFLEEFPVQAFAVRDVIPLQISPKKKSPLGLVKGFYAKHAVELLTPGRTLIPPRQTTESTDGIEYSRLFNYRGESLSMEFNLKISERSVTADGFDRVTSIAETIAEQSQIVFFVNKASKTLSGILGEETALMHSEQTEILNAGQLIADREFVEAVSKINSLLEIYADYDSLRGFLLQLKGEALMGLRRPRPAITAYAEGFELHRPADGFRYIGYLEALSFVEDANTLASTLTRMLNEHPAMLQYVPDRAIASLTNQLRADNENVLRDQLILSTAKASSQNDEDAIQEYRWLFLEATLSAARKGDLESARDLLTHIKSPHDFSAILAMKDTEALWPEIQKETGDDLTRAIENYVTFSDELAKSDPDNFDYQRQYLAALRYAQRYDEAIVFAQESLGDWKTVEAIGREAFWFINTYALAAFDNGDLERSDRILERLLALDIEQYNSLFYVAVNRARLLLRRGEYQSALAAIEVLEKLDEDHASDFGWASVFHVKTCATFASGREDAAYQIFEESLMPVAEQNDRALASTLLCMNRLDEAADHLLQRLNDPAKSQEAVLVYRSVKASSKLTPYLEMLLERNESIKARPDVIAAFDKVGRELVVNGSTSHWYAF